MIKRNFTKIAIIIVLIVFSIICATISQKTSFGVEFKEKTILEGAIDKYINYELENGNKGTLVQYQLRTGIEYGDEFFPIKNSELQVSLNQIDGKYPYEVKVIAKSTKATNGKKSDIEEYNYDINTGVLTIKTSNQNEEGEIINSENLGKDARDEFIIIANYDTYTNEKIEREINCVVKYKAQLATEDSREIIGQGKLEKKVTENEGKLTSVSRNISEIYNGYIKSNVINGTTYDTEYIETNEIVISEKEAQNKLEIQEENTYINLNDIEYKSTKILKDEIISLLGENGNIQILDENNNVLAEINKNTQFNENGEFIISYGENVKRITIKTSDIEKEGILQIENTKKIRGDISNLEDKDIVSKISLIGLKEEIEVDAEVNTNENEKIEEENRIVDKEVYRNQEENIIEIKDSVTNVNLDVDNTKWTNEGQNTVNLTVTLNSSEIKYNLFKNPTIKIDLPKEVEKVILGNSQLVYGNGLTLGDVYTKTNEDETISVFAEITGVQEKYVENNIGLSTTLTIPMNIMIRKDIENSLDSTINVVYTNEYTGEQGEVNQNIKIQAYIGNRQIASNTEDENKFNIQEILEEKHEEIIQNVIMQNIDADEYGLEVKIEPYKGNQDKILQNGDVLYPGEYITYRITYTSKKNIEDLKFVLTIPEGLTYGKLNATFDEMNEGIYEYEFFENQKEVEINVGSINAGTKYISYIDCKVDDLLEGETSKDIETTIKTLINNQEIDEVKNNYKVEQGEAKIFIAPYLEGYNGEWAYNIDLELPREKSAKVKLVFPEGVKIEPSTTEEGQAYVTPIRSDFEGVTDFKYQFGTDETTGKDFVTINTFYGGNLKLHVAIKILDESKIIELYRKSLKTSKSDEDYNMRAYATMEVDGKTYYSNEGKSKRKTYEAKVTMTSENEGEEVKVGEEIEYRINIKALSAEVNNIKAMSINIVDYIPEQLDINSVTYEYFDLLSDDDENGVGNPIGFSEKKTKTLTEFYRKTDLEGNILPDINFQAWIPEGENINIIIKTTAKTVFTRTEIENSATIQDKAIEVGESETAEKYIEPQTSNVVKHIIVPVEDSTEEPDDPDQPIDPDDPDDPDKPDNPDDPDDPVDPNAKYSISGVVWNDVNGDGERQRTEDLLSGIQVLLVDLNDSANVKAQTTTSNGKYTFEELEQTNYLVIFKYNTILYSLTEYKKNGVPENVNSDATEQRIILDGQQIDVAVTDEISLSRDENNIDVGLISKDSYDLKLDKYITDITVATVNGTKQYSYDNTKLGKVEIRAKELNGAEVTVKYKIVITNEGKTSATVKEIYDYLPSGLEFSANGNSNWIETNGILVNRSLSGQVIKAGETKEITLTLTKTMNGEDTGTFINAAEIGKVSDTEIGINDTDSTPGNKNVNEDDYSEAELIISIGTGLGIYITLTIAIILVIAIIIAVIIKFKISPKKITKIGMFIGILMMVGLTSTSQVYAASPPLYASYTYVTGMRHTFVGGPQGVGGTCYNFERRAAGTNCSHYPYYGAVVYTYTGVATGKTEGDATDIKTISDPIKLEKLNDTIEIRKVGEDYVLGPFEVRSNSTNDCFLSVFDKEGNELANWTACDADGTPQGTIPGNKSFYLRLTEEHFSKGIASVKLSQSKRYAYSYKVKVSGQAYYYLPGIGQADCEVAAYDENLGGYYGEMLDCHGHQGVHSHIFIWGEDEREEEEETWDDIEWRQFNSTLDLIKVDDDNPNLKIDIEGTLSKDDGSYKKDFKTTEGQYHFDNLTPGKYTLTETVNNNYGYEKNEQKQISVSIASGETHEITMTNVDYTGNLKIIKKDLDANDENKKLIEGVEFKLRDAEGYIIGVDENEKEISNTKGTVRFYNMNHTNDINKATTFITDSNGEINIYNIRDGVYTVKEVSVGDNYGYDIDDNYIFWNNGNEEGTGSEGTIEVTRRESTVTSDTSTTDEEDKFTIMTFQNRRKYIKLSGLVWEDMISGKTSERDWKYSQGESDETNPDKLVSNVTVKLKDANGNDVSFKTEDGRTVTEILTDKNGSYTMVDILIDKLNEYYVEFTYNGMSYTSVPIIDLLPETVNSSKAKENDEERTEFNNNYSTITHSGTTDAVGQALNASGSKTYDLQYDETEHYVDETGATIDQVKSTLNYGENSVYGYEGQRFPVNMTDEQYLIKATTKDAYQDNGQSGYLSDMYTAEEIRKSSLEEIKNVNLGLYEREQPDIAIVEDVDTAKVTLNGYEHTYKYSQRFNANQESDGFNVGVKFGNEYGSASYTRTIYSSDMVYNMQPGNEGKLGVYITYKIALRNEATNLFTRINEVINYYDERYDIYSITDESGANLAYSEQGSAGNGFNKVVIETNQNIENQKQRIIYITYKLQNDAVNAVLNQDVTLDSVTEISSYSTYSDANYTTHYAGVDKDSRPGSAIPENANNSSDDENVNTYEDDTDSAPSLILQVEEGRIIRGTVWEDNAIEELFTNTGYDKERKGDGLYANNENVVEKVKVELLTCTDDGNPGEVATLYHKNEALEEAEVYTGNDGSYEFSGIIPGKYLIRYTYGNESIIVSPDGSSTPIETVEKYKSTIYRAGDKTAAEAMTDYWYRTETGEGNTRMSDAKDEIGINSDGTRYDIVAERTEESGENVYTYGTITSENGIENPSNLENIEADTRIFDIKLDYDINLDNISEYGADLKFIFDNIDFGIVRRPIQNLDVRKEISYVQVKLANGQILIEGDPREGATNYLRFLPDGNVHLEIDQELIQGATITIRYEIVVDNREAEIDYNNEDYYIYGIVPTNHENWKIARISKLYDYLSNELIYDANNANNVNWTQIEIGQSLVTEGRLSQEAFETVKQFNQVLQTDAFKDMEPGQEIRVPLEVSRILSNSSGDLTFTNDIEVNEVTGRKMEHDGDYTIPGNYEPSNGETGYDDDYVYLTITGPTGENRNYIQYIILGTIGLITLGAGIILIKKKVL